MTTETKNKKSGCLILLIIAAILIWYFWPPNTSPIVGKWQQVYVGTSLVPIPDKDVPKVLYFRPNGTFTETRDGYLSNQGEYAVGGEISTNPGYFQITMKNFENNIFMGSTVHKPEINGMLHFREDGLLEMTFHSYKLSFPY